MGENLETLRRLIDAFVARDFERGSAELHPALVVDEPPGLPQGGEWRGQDASARIKRLILDTWDQQPGPIRYWECADAVFSHRRTRWTAKATGRSVETDVLEHYEFSDGRISRISVYIKDAVGLRATVEPGPAA